MRALRWLSRSGAADFPAPHEALMLRDIFAAVQPGYHMNKKHWITVVLDGSVPVGELARLIEQSWRLVVAGLAKRHQDALHLRTL